jgi:hypothetical protein
MTEAGQDGNKTLGDQVLHSACRLLFHSPMPGTSPRRSPGEGLLVSHCDKARFAEEACSTYADSVYFRVLHSKLNRNEGM